MLKYGRTKKLKLRAFGFGLNGEMFEHVATRFTFRNSLRILDEPELLKAVLLQMFGFETARSKAVVWKKASALIDANFSPLFVTIK